MDPSAKPAVTDPSPDIAGRGRRRAVLLVWGLVYLLTAASIQWGTQVSKSDLGGDPDEAAHAVTSLMVRDYLVDGLGQHPLKFAQDYYDRLPKVALGHYPPGFYALSGLWLGPAPSISALFYLQALLLAGWATLAAWLGSRIMPPLLAAVVAWMLCFAPPMHQLVGLIMSDILLSGTCLASAVAMVLFLERPGRMSALAFGIAAAFAILVKGSGVMLALLPPFAILVAGQWRLLLRPVLWLAPLPVLLFALPWQLFSYKFTQEGMSGLSFSGHFQAALGYYARVAPETFGWPVIAGLALALFQAVGQRERRRVPGAAVLWGMVFAGLVLVLTVPAGLSPRYLVPLVVPVALLFAAGLYDLLGSALRVRSGGAATLVALILAGSLWSTGKAVPQTKQVHGYADVVGRLTSTRSPVSGAPDAWMICSDPRGEGAVIAAAAFHPQLRETGDTHLKRATKELAAMDWLGRGYTPAFGDDQALLEHLAKTHVSAVLVDESVPESARMPFYTQLQAAMTRPDSGWELAFSVPAERPASRGLILVYQRSPAP